MRLRAFAASILLAVAFAGCSGSNPDPCEADTDGDGILDCQETAGWDVTVDLVGPERGLHRVRYHVTSDPALRDTDGDGLPDIYEYVLGLDPRKADTDEDGLTDCQEKMHTVRAECEGPFTGTTDGGYGTEANRASTACCFSRFQSTRPIQDETGTLPRPLMFGDGIRDGEKAHGLAVTLGDGTQKQVFLKALEKDADGDRLEDAEEIFVFGTDPTVADADGDGCIDGLDPIPAFTERYHLGLDTLALTGSQDADIAVVGIIANAVVQAPAAGSWRVVGGGVANDVSHLEDPAGFRSDQCSFATWDPWLYLSATVIRQDGPGGPLDFASESPSATVSWNAHTGQFRWNMDHDVDGGPGPEFDPFDGPLRMSGKDGTLVLRPHLSGVPQDYLENLADYQSALNP